MTSIINIKCLKTIIRNKNALDIYMIIIFFIKYISYKNAHDRTTLKSWFSVTWFNVSVGKILRRGVWTVRGRRWSRARKSSSSVTTERAVPTISVLSFAVAKSTAHCICTLVRWQCYRDLKCFWYASLKVKTMSEKTKRRRLSFKEKYELIKEVKADTPKECTLNKYRITDRMYNRVLDKQPEVTVKVKSCEFEKKSSKTSLVVIKMIILEKKLRIYIHKYFLLTTHGCEQEGTSFALASTQQKRSAYVFTWSKETAAWK